MPNPSWFNEAYYATQKVAQMNATGYGKDWLATQEGAPTEWTVDLYNQYLTQYRTTEAVQVGDVNLAAGSAVSAYQNFVACNSMGYVAGITAEDINVAPNEYFNVPVYLQNVANWRNAQTNDANAPEGGWTVQTVLDEMVRLHTSAWEHYTHEGMAAGIDPSNLFSTSAYLEARAQAMGEGATVADALAAIQAAGLNAIQDWYEYGQAHEITDAPISTAPVTPEVPSGWNQWGSGGTPTPPEDNDPYEQNVTTVDLANDQTTYPGAGESYSGNTRFDALWTSSIPSNTLNVNDVITGLSGQYNTLAIDLGNNWNGFKQQQVDGKDVASVTNIGRIELNHTAKNAERGYTFDATGIEGAERVDINNTGAGSISLKNLSNSVNQINIDTLTPRNVNDTTIMDTTLSWATNELKGKADVLDLGLTDVGQTSDKGPSYAPIISDGIETLNIHSKGHDGNFVSLDEFKGIKTLNVDGAANLTILDTPDGIGTFDASAATGNVNFGANGVKSATVVKGGSGLDTLTLNNNVTIHPASWTDVEQLAVTQGANVNADNVAGLQTLWIKGGTATTLKGLQQTTDFAVHQTSSTSSVNTVRGDIANLTFYADATISGGSLSSDASQNVNISTTGSNDLLSSWTGTFKNAQGDVTVYVAEGTDKDAGNFGGSVTAKNAQSLTINAEGYLLGGATFNVVDGTPAAGRSITINSAHGIQSSAVTGTPASLDTSGALPFITLNGNGATELAINATGSFLATGSLKGVENVTVTLDTTKDAHNGTTPGTFSLFELNADLDAAQNVTVNGGGETVHFQDLGNGRANGGITLNVNDALEFRVGDIKTGLGWNIDANITAENIVQFGTEISTTTNTATNTQGDVSIVVETENSSAAVGGFAGGVSAATTISGGDITVNFSGVQGDAWTTNEHLTLNAQETITYTGANGKDFLNVAHVGAGSSSIALGNDADILTIATGAVSRGTTATITVNLEEDTAAGDSVTISSQTTGNLVVNLQNIDSLDTLTLGTSAATLTSSASAASALLTAFGLSASGLKMVTAGNVLDSGTTTLANVAYTDGTNVYLFDNNAAASAHVAIVMGVDDCNITSTADFSA